MRMRMFAVSFNVILAKSVEWGVGMFTRNSAAACLAVAIAVLFGAAAIAETEDFSNETPGVQPNPFTNVENTLQLTSTGALIEHNIIAEALDVFVGAEAAPAFANITPTGTVTE